MPTAEVSINNNEIVRLYNYASKNKIGFFFLETLIKYVHFQNVELEYKNQQGKYSECINTLIRIARLFNSGGVNYVIFKSILPYPAIPNDIDILILGTDIEYRKTIDMLLNANYAQVAEAPSEIFIHDRRNCEHGHPWENKDVYDIDLYKEISASYINYMNKKNFIQYKSKSNVLGEEVITLKPEADLVVMLVHSIFPEQIFTLFHYYITLYHLSRMTEEQIRNLISIVKENNVRFAVASSVSLTAKLHAVAHGFVPQRLLKLLVELGSGLTDLRKLVRNNFEMPHKYSIFTVAGTLLEKSKEKDAALSIIAQIMKMLRPSFGTYVLKQLINRRRRETY